MTRTIRIEGALDAARIQASRRMLDQFAAEEADLFIDMTDCDFLDSSGVGAVVFVYKRKLARGYIVRMTNLTGQPLSLLRHLGIANLLAADERTAA